MNLYFAWVGVISCFWLEGWRRGVGDGGWGMGDITN
jgi:hypothetical protein